MKDLLPPFLFQTWNFEDFLLMHLPGGLLEKWRKLREVEEHRRNPMKAKDYLQTFGEFCRSHEGVIPFESRYEKGSMPFALTAEHLANLLANNEADFPRSDFAEFLKRTIPALRADEESAGGGGEE